MENQKQTGVSNLAADRIENQDNNHRGALILIVDDEPLALDLSSTALQRKGFNTAVARSGEEGWSMINKLHPDMVLLDIMMPDIDGFEVFERMRDHPATQMTPVMFVTARDDLDHRMKGLELGAVDYITKPYNVNELVARVRSTLRLRQLEKQLLAREREDIRRNAVRQLLTTVAHYINNSVAAIEGHIKVCDPQNPESVGKMKEVIVRQTRVITATIQGIDELLKRMELATVNYSSLNVIMLDIEDSMKQRLEEFGRHDREMGRL